MVIPTQFTSTPSTNVNISTVAEPDVSPTTPTAAFAQAKTGLPATPEKKLNIMVDDMFQYEV